ncbi:hypothetical protein HYW21_05865 [Candidatus Woesearchaeota archaeon]|nr:hypothetical protein [Candidatus Woesearchaeota archaeon]
MITIQRLLSVSVLLMFLIGTLPLSSALIDVTVNLTYDRNGNLMQDANYYYQYNSEHQLSKVRDKNATGRILAEYEYDHLGQRSYKIEYHADGTNTSTYYVGNDFVQVVRPDGRVENTQYYYDNNGVLLARKDPDGKKYFYHPDALGSTALVTDEAGNVVEEVEYLPFGEVIEGGNDRYLFTGKEKDRETGLQYYDARYYAPDQARFIQPDIAQPDIYDPQQLNKYSYARNNPVKYMDPNGESPTLAFGLIGIAIGGVTGGTINLATQLYHGASITKGTVDWHQVGKSATVGAASGGVAGLTLGIGSLVAGGAGLSLGAEMGLGAASGVAGGRAGTATANVLEGEKVTKDILSPAGIATDALIGGATAGAGRTFKSAYIEKSWAAGGESSSYKNMLEHQSKVRTNPAGYNPYKFTVEANKFKSNFGKPRESDYVQVSKIYDEWKPFTGTGRIEPGFRRVNPKTGELVYIDSYETLYSYHSPKP